MAAASLPDWGELPDDSKWVYEALAKLTCAADHSEPLAVDDPTFMQSQCNRC